jgi:hypothetical protein
MLVFKTNYYVFKEKLIMTLLSQMAKKLSVAKKLPKFKAKNQTQIIHVIS